MPKLKTNKGVAKRIKITKNGKIKRNRPGRRHLLGHKSRKQKRRLRKSADVEKKFAKNYKAVMHG